jgi:acetyltransferase-like isoleucine patch superfamily enzyme
MIGAGAVIRQGIKIGSNVMVGAGAVVVADVCDGQVVVGIPAKPLPVDEMNK